MLRSWPWVVLLVLSACSVDAEVYRALVDRRPVDAASPDETERDSSTAGAAGAAGVGGEGSFSCGGAGGAGGADAVMPDGAGAPMGWFRFDLPCSSNADCGRTLFAPVCDLERSVCVGCPTTAEQTALTAGVIVCLTDARERCCRDSTSAPDCIFRDCIMRCGLQ